MAWSFKKKEADAAPQQQAKAEPAAAAPQKKNYVPLIVKAAKKHGVPIGQAMKVAGAEGGANRWIRSKARNKAGILEPSYGPFQALVGGGDTGFPTGLGNEMLKRGIDPRTDAQAEEYFDVVMETVAKDGGWGQWRGADQFDFGSKKSSRGRAHAAGGQVPSGAAAAPTGEGDDGLFDVSDLELASTDGEDVGGMDEMAAVEEDPIDKEERTISDVIGSMDFSDFGGNADQLSSALAGVDATQEDVMSMILNGVEQQQSGGTLPKLPGFPDMRGGFQA